MEEKKEKTMQEKMNLRREILVVSGFCLYIIGAILVVAQVAAAGTYNDLRSDDYMDDPTIPYNERANATYTFTDQFLKDTYNRLIWYVVPGGIIFIAGLVMLSTSGLLINDKEVHQNFCKGTGEAKYCSECGLKLSRLEKK